jgi:putative ABC transport system substrate-binding protein
LAAELVRLPVDVLVASATPASLAAKRATTTVPIVSIYTLDPVAAGLVASLAHPGGNVTGLSTLSLEYVGKMLELLTRVGPKTSRVAVLGDPSNPSYTLYWSHLDASARTLRLALMRADARRPEELEGLFAKLREGPAPQALLVMHQPLTFVHRKPIVRLAAEHRLPAGPSDEGGSHRGLGAGGVAQRGPDSSRRWARGTIPPRPSLLLVSVLLSALSRGEQIELRWIDGWRKIAAVLSQPTIAG